MVYSYDRYQYFILYKCEIYMNEHFYAFSSLLKNTVPEKRRTLRKYFRNNPDFKIPTNSCTIFDV